MAYVDALSELEDFGDGSKPWADFVFDLTSVEINKPPASGAPETIAFEMRASHVEGDIGLSVKLSPTEWTLDTRDPDLLLSWGRVTLMSAGPSSDLLVRLYENWWGVPPRSRSAVDLITVQAVCIGDDVRTAEDRQLHLKLFFEPAREWDGDDEDPDYAELYLNFDLSGRRGWLREKDESYRSAVVGWLSGELRGA